MLHIITRSPFTSTALTDCLEFAHETSNILLISSGVYGTHHHALKQVNTLNIYAIEEDVEARSLKKVNGILYINYLQMVGLTETNHPIQTWS